MGTAGEGFAGDIAGAGRSSVSTMGVVGGCETPERWASFCAAAPSCATAGIENTHSATVAHSNPTVEFFPAFQSLAILMQPPHGSSARCPAAPHRAMARAIYNLVNTETRSIGLRARGNPRQGIETTNRSVRFESRKAAAEYRDL